MECGLILAMMATFITKLVQNTSGMKPTGCVKNLIQIWLMLITRTSLMLCFRKQPLRDSGYILFLGNYHSTHHSRAVLIQGWSKIAWEYYCMWRRKWEQLWRAFVLDQKQSGSKFSWSYCLSWWVTPLTRRVSNYGVSRFVVIFREGKCVYLQNSILTLFDCGDTERPKRVLCQRKCSFHIDEPRKSFKATDPTFS